jgi:hypothetical protein
MNQNKRGGARPNAGRKKSEATEVLYCRVPKSIFIELSDYVHKAVEAHKAKSFLK